MFDTGAVSALVSRWSRDLGRRLLITDIVAIMLGVGVSQFLSFGLLRSELVIPPGELDTFTARFIAIWVAFVAAWTVALGLGATRSEKVIGTGAEYRRVVSATMQVFGFVAILVFFLKADLGRGYFLTALPAGLGLLLFGRWVQRRWLLAQRRRGAYLRRALVVGSRGKSQHVASSILREGPATGLVLVGALTKHGGSTETLVEGVPVVGDYGDVLRATETTSADTLIFTGADELTPRELRELGWQLQDRNVDLIVVPSLTDVAGPRIHARPVAGLPLIHVDYPVFEGVKYYAKRTFDIGASGLGLVLLSPLLLLIALAVRLESPGPVLFRQRRVGMNGSAFSMFKFRSMVVDAEERLAELEHRSDGNGVLFKLKADPRVTRVGRFLRRYSLDELPQLLNVFIGDMSLVGPRPPLQREVELYDHWANRRLLVKPGITGLWQVSGRSDLSWEDSVRLDLYYVENWSLVGDILILARTLRAVVASQGAY